MSRCRLSGSVDMLAVRGASDSDRLTFFRSAARGLHVPTRLAREPTKHEARKRRASVRPRVGCCEELGGNSPRKVWRWRHVWWVWREFCGEFQVNVASLHSVHMVRHIENLRVDAASAGSRRELVAA